MDLVRELLDNKVVDRNGRELGRVDSIVLTCHHGEPPRVAAIEIGPAVLAARLWPALQRWVEGLEHALGGAEGRPTKIPLSSVISLGEVVKVDVAFGDVPASAIELWLRRCLRPIPEIRRARGKS